MTSSATYHVFRLQPSTDLKLALIGFVNENNIKAGVVVSCVGSLEQYHLRFANQKKGFRENGFFEILSLSGTLSTEGVHLHMAIADSQGRAIGGHLLEGSLIYTTAEIIIAEMDHLLFTRKVDPRYGYRELKIEPNRS